MTLPFSERKSGPYVATAGQTVFNYGFPITAAGDLTVYRLRAGVEIVLQLGNLYQVTNVGQPAGTIVLNSGALAGDVYVIYGSKPLARSTAFPGWRSIPDGAVDAELNALQVQIQELRRDLTRALVPSPTQAVNLVLPDPVAGRVLGWNDTATGLENRSPPLFVTRGAWGPVIDYASGDIVTRLGQSYIATDGHQSTFSTEPGIGPDWQTVWQLLAAKGDAGIPGPGTGDLLAANNLSDLANAAVARVSLGLGALAVLSSVATAQIGNDSITYAKMQNVSASDRLLGRVSASAGDVEEIPFTDYAQGLIAQADEATFKAYTNLEIGVDVQAWSTALDQWATKARPAGVVVGTSDAQTLTAKVIDASSNTISNLTTTMFAANVIDNDATLAAASSTRIATQSAIKSYVDNAVTGLKWKPAVSVATTANIVLSGEQTIDGVLTSTSRVLVKNQTDPTQNGIYLSAAGAWSRVTDADTGTELVAAAVFVLQGTVQNTTQWTNNNPSITLGVTGVTFVQIAGAGTYSASGGLALSGNDFSIANDGVTFAKFQNITSDRLVGRDTASSGDVEEISVTGGLEFSGASSIQRSALTGDVTAPAGSNATTIAAQAVTFAKFQNVATDVLIGRDTAATGSVEQIAVGGGLEFTGSAGIQRSALTGDITAAAGSGATTIAAQAVTFAKFQNIGTDRLIGRDAASSGVAQEIELVGGLEFTGGNQIHVAAFTGDVTKAAGGTTTTIANNVVTLAKLAQIDTARFLGRVTASTGNVEALTGAQATSLLNVFTADDGTNPGLKGLVPAPAAGDAAGLKFLRADGLWVVPAGGGGGGLADGSYGGVTVSSGGSLIEVNDEHITNARLAHMAQATLKGRAAGAGTGDATDLTKTQALELLSAFSGVNLQVFTSSGTYTPTTGMKYCLVFTTGAGGGGGGADSTDGSSDPAASGGGSAPTTVSLFTAATIGASQGVTIGAGGTGGANTGGNGGTGGTTSFGSLHVITGGLGGAGHAIASGFATAKGGAGGAATTAGQVTFQGGYGGPAWNYPGDACWGGLGAPSFWGPGSVGGVANQGNESGTPAYGAGGGGATARNFTTGNLGGTGGGGFVFIIEFF